jgi:hypothetical protein
MSGKEKRQKMVRAGCCCRPAGNSAAGGRGSVRSGGVDGCVSLAALVCLFAACHTPQEPAGHHGDSDQCQPVAPQHRAGVCVCVCVPARMCGCGHACSCAAQPPRRAVLMLLTPPCRASPRADVHICGEASDGGAGAARELGCAQAAWRAVWRGCVCSLRRAPVLLHSNQDNSAALTHTVFRAISCTLVVPPQLQLAGTARQAGSSRGMLSGTASPPSEVSAAAERHAADEHGWEVRWSGQLPCAPSSRLCRQPRGCHAHAMNIRHACPCAPCRVTGAPGAGAV